MMQYPRAAGRGLAAGDADDVQACGAGGRRAQRPGALPQPARVCRYAIESGLVAAGDVLAADRAVARGTGAYHFARRGH